MTAIRVRIMMAIRVIRIIIAIRVIRILTRVIRILARVIRIARIHGDHDACRREQHCYQCHHSNDFRAAPGFPHANTVCHIGTPAVRGYP
jgi:hypothetical protein